MRKKKVTLSFVPNEKVKIYLERFGFIDGRTGNKKKHSTLNLSNFINDCLVLMAEGEKNPLYDLARPDELRIAWIKYQAALNNRELERLRLENELLARQAASAKVDVLHN